MNDKLTYDHCRCLEHNALTLGGLALSEEKWVRRCDLLVALALSTCYPLHVSNTHQPSFSVSTNRIVIWDVYDSAPNGLIELAMANGTTRIRQECLHNVRKSVPDLDKIRSLATSAVVRS